MAEALGVVAGGFISLAKDVVDIGNELRQYYKKVISDARERLGEIIAVVEDDLLPMQKLHDLHSGQMGTVFTSTSALATSISSCQTGLRDLNFSLSDLYQKLEKKGGKIDDLKATIQRLKWPFDQGSFQRELNAIQQHSTIFQFAFALDCFTLLSKSLQDVTEILKRQKHIERRRQVSCSP